jgi:predicted outer membrane repeat protein
MMNSTVSGNTSESSGGGIFNGGTLTITDSVISGNTVSYNGGGIENVGSLTMTNSTVSNNTAAAGGGILNKTLKRIWVVGLREMQRR